MAQDPLRGGATTRPLSADSLSSSAPRFEKPSGIPAHLSSVPWRASPIPKNVFNKLIRPQIPPVASPNDKHNGDSFKPPLAIPERKAISLSSAPQGTKAVSLSASDSAADDMLRRGGVKETEALTTPQPVKAGVGLKTSSKPTGVNSNNFASPSLLGAYGDQHYVNEIEEDMDVSLHDFDPQSHAADQPLSPSNQGVTEAVAVEIPAEEDIAASDRSPKLVHKDDVAPAPSTKSPSPGKRDAGKSTVPHTAKTKEDPPTESTEARPSVVRDPNPPIHQSSEKSNPQPASEQTPPVSEYEPVSRPGTGSLEEGPGVAPAPPKAKKEPVRLTEWTLRPQETRVCVEGFREPEGIYWHSSVIVQRQSAREVLTRTGNMYVLLGPIDDGKMRAQRFPDDIIESFADGFPDDWATILPGCLSQMSSVASRKVPLLAGAEPEAAPPEPVAGEAKTLEADISEPGPSEAVDTTALPSRSRTKADRIRERLRAKQQSPDLASSEPEDRSKTQEVKEVDKSHEEKSTASEHPAEQSSASAPSVVDHSPANPLIVTDQSSASALPEAEHASSASVSAEAHQSLAAKEAQDSTMSVAPTLVDGKMRFPCNLCDKSYSWYRGLKDHRKNAHRLSTGPPAPEILEAEHEKRRSLEQAKASFPNTPSDRPRQPSRSSSKTITPAPHDGSASKAHSRGRSAPEPTPNQQPRSTPRSIRGASAAAKADKLLDTSSAADIVKGVKSPSETPRRSKSVEQGSKDVAPSDTTAPVFLVDGDANDTAADSANTIRPRIIHGQVRYPCQLCGKNYSWVSDLRRHRKELHHLSTEVPEEVLKYDNARKRGTKTSASPLPDIGGSKQQGATDDSTQDPIDSGVAVPASNGGADMAAEASVQPITEPEARENGDQGLSTPARQQRNAKPEGYHLTPAERTRSKITTTTTSSDNNEAPPRTQEIMQNASSPQPSATSREQTKTVSGEESLLDVPTPASPSTGIHMSPRTPARKQPAETPPKPSTPHATKSPQRSPARKLKNEPLSSLAPSATVSPRPSPRRRTPQNERLSAPGPSPTVSPRPSPRRNTPQNEQLSAPVPSATISPRHSSRRPAARGQTDSTAAFVHPGTDDAEIDWDNGGVEGELDLSAVEEQEPKARAQASSSRKNKRRRVIDSDEEDEPAYESAGKQSTLGEGPGAAKRRKTDAAKPSHGETSGDKERSSTGAHGKAAARISTSDVVVGQELSDEADVMAKTNQARAANSGEEASPHKQSGKRPRKRTAKSVEPVSDGSEWVDEGVGQRRSGRKRIEPLKYWEGEVLKVTVYTATTNDPEKMIQTKVGTYGVAAHAEARRPKVKETSTIRPATERGEQPPAQPSAPGNTSSHGKRPWSEEEKSRLALAVARVRPSSQTFWQDVAAKLGGERSADECYDMNHQMEAAEKESKHNGRHQSRREPARNRPRTLKERKAIRDYLQQQEADHEDDAFESTPFRDAVAKRNREPDAESQTPAFRGRVDMKITPYHNASSIDDRRSSIGISPASIRKPIDRAASDQYISHLKGGSRSNKQFQVALNAGRGVDGRHGNDGFKKPQHKSKPVSDYQRIMDKSRRDEEEDVESRMEALYADDDTDDFQSD